MDERVKERVLGLLGGIIPYVRGILIYGSAVKGYADKNSDIDICLLQKDGISLKNLYQKIFYVSTDEKYDIVLFDEIPWYLRGEILENNEIIYAENPDELDFWLYKQMKIWNGMKIRQRSVSAEDLIERVKRGGLGINE